MMMMMMMMSSRTRASEWNIIDDNIRQLTRELIIAIEKASHRNCLLILHVALALVRLQIVMM